jgi:hypothetical protein
LLNIPKGSKIKLIVKMQLVVEDSSAILPDDNSSIHRLAANRIMTRD